MTSARCASSGIPQASNECLMRTCASEVLEEITMTVISNSPADSNKAVDTSSNILANFPVGGVDPDFVVVESNKPAICAVPVVGKMLPQCK